MPHERFCLGTLLVEDFAAFFVVKDFEVLLAVDFSETVSLAVMRVTLDVFWFLATPTFLPN